jgi:hypothetical protein
MRPLRSTALAMLALRWGVLLALTGCRFWGAKDCETVAVDVPAALRPPPLSRTGPVTVGETVPVYRMSQRHWSADELVGATLMLACTIKDDLTATRELDAWAERAASAGANDLISATPLSDRRFHVSFETDEPRILRVGVNETEFLSHDELGSNAALSVAHDTIRRLERFGMTQGAFDPDPVASHVWKHHIGDSERTDVQTIVDFYSLSFGLRRGDIEVAGPLLEMEVSGSGVVRSLAWAELDVVEVGTARVALDEPGADARFRKLIIGEGFPEGVHAHFDAWRTVYRLGSTETEDEVGLRRTSKYCFSSDGGGVSWSKIGAVSMTDPDAPLISIAP